MVGIEEVAELAGVSTATVSRALNGKDHVSPRSKERVLKAASELGYVASSSAYTLATGRNRNIGVVVPHISRWFFSTMLEAIVNVFIERGYDLTLYNLSGGGHRDHRVFNDLLLRKRVDGVLTIAVSLTDQELEKLNQTKKPFIGIGGAIHGARYVLIDDIAAGKLATEHLISLGHTRIGHIGGNPAAEMEFAQPHKRHMGYMEALREAGIEVRDSLFLASDLTTSAAYHAAKQMLGNPREAPTAIFCASDEMGFGAIMAAKDLGLRVPEDVSIVGIDNHDMSEFYGLTTVNQEVRAQGISAALKLLNLLENQVDGAPVNVEEETVWPTSLMIRSSTAKRMPDAR